MFKYIFTTKLLFRLFAITVCFLIFISTTFYVHKSNTELFDFFKLDAHDIFRQLSLSISILIGAGTIVQSSPFIWDNLSYWGQRVDNLLLYLLYRKKYYLNEVENILGEIRQLLNEFNSESQNCLWKLTVSKGSNINDAMEKISALLKSKIKKARILSKKAFYLLKKNEAADNISRSRKNNADQLLNELIIEISDILDRILNMKTMGNK